MTSDFISETSAIEKKGQELSFIWQAQSKAARNGGSGQSASVEAGVL